PGRMAAAATPTATTIAPWASTSLRSASARYRPASSASAGNAGRTYAGSFELEAEKKASTTSAQRASQNVASKGGAGLRNPRHHPTAAGSSSGARPSASTGRKNQTGAVR